MWSASHIDEFAECPGYILYSFSSLVLSLVVITPSMFPKCISLLIDTHVKKK